MNIVDVLIILALLYGAVLGFKRGFISSAVSFVGMIIVIILAFLLKNPISTLLYTYMPFFNFSGVFQDVTALNILIYEGIAFLLVFSLLSAALRIIIRMTGIVDKIVKYTIILAIPSKILGAIFGVLQLFIFTFVVLFVSNNINITKELIDDSRLANPILQRTPILSNIVGPVFNSVEEIYSLREKHPNAGMDYNIETLNVLLNNNVISTKSARRLVEREKLPKEALPIIELHER